MSTTPSLPALADFSVQCGTAFAIAGLNGVALDLFEALPLDSRAPDERRFSLMFQGPAQPALEQAIHTLEHPVLGTLAIFLVPVGRDARGMQYQAIFN
ncbi:MAG TPA: hypothetical protein DCX52_03555 [Massilia sp.]|nr:hypothetical protein [Massilia sp.]